MKLWPLLGKSQKPGGGAMSFGTSIYLALRSARGGGLGRPDSLPANRVGNAHEIKS
jgi:hypothetical protein